MSKKKICFLAQFPPPMNGLTKAIDTLYNSDINQEFELQKIDLTHNKHFERVLFSIIKSNADLFYFTIGQSKGGNLRDLFILKILELKRKKCLIHLHGGFYRQLVDNGMPNWQRKANFKAISKLSGAIVLGKSLKYIFEGMIDKGKIFVVPNCVDDEFLLSDEEFIEKTENIENKKIKRVLYLSNFIKSKGYVELLEMAKLEKERCEAGGERKFHFDFAGGFFEELEEEFLNYIKENELADYVTYHGIVGGNDKRQLLKDCDFFALLTRYPKEGQPISILEAMGNGLVVVTTNHAGVPDIVNKDFNIVVDKNQIDVEDIYNNLTINAEMIKANRNDVFQSYKQNHYIENMKKIFEKL